METNRGGGATVVDGVPPLSLFTIIFLLSIDFHPELATIRHMKNPTTTVIKFVEPVLAPVAFVIQDPDTRCASALGAYQGLLSFHITSMFYDVTDNTTPDAVRLQRVYQTLRMIETRLAEVNAGLLASYGKQTKEESLV